MDSFISNQIENSLQIKHAIVNSPTFMSELKEACQLCLEAYKNGGKLIIAGNGGSAADAQHIAGELISRFYFDRPALPGIALTTDTSIITAISNDYGYEKQMFCSGDIIPLENAVKTLQGVIITPDYFKRKIVVTSTRSICNEYSKYL